MAMAHLKYAEDSKSSSKRTYLSWTDTREQPSGSVWGWGGF